jgi:hypothetical protein
MVRPQFNRLAVLAVLCLATSLSLTSCTAGTPPPAHSTSESIAELAKEQLGHLAGVESVSSTQSPAGSLQDTASLDPWNAASWSIDLAVTMTDNAPADEVANAAERTYRFSRTYATTGHWSALILAGGNATKYAEDTSPLPAVQLEVFPDVWRSPTQAARAILEAKSAVGVNRVAVAADRPYVDVVNVSDLGSVYDRIQILALFDQGGQFGTSDGRVRISDVPEHLSDFGIHAIIALAVAYPDANVWVEASPHGWPVLYIDHVTASEAPAITATLSAPDMSAANTGNYVVPFYVSVTGPDGRTDSHGTFGNAPAA